MHDGRLEQRRSGSLKDGTFRYQRFYRMGRSPGHIFAIEAFLTSREIGHLVVVKVFLRSIKYYLPHPSNFSRTCMGIWPIH